MHCLEVAWVSLFFLLVSSSLGFDCTPLVPYRVFSAHLGLEVQQSRRGCVSSLRERSGDVGESISGDDWTLSGDGDGGGREKRRVKRNKYARFSKAPPGGARGPWDLLNGGNDGRDVEEGKLGIVGGDGDSDGDSDVGGAPLAPKMTFPPVVGITPSDPTTFGFVPLGRISSSHGVRGFVRVKNAESDSGDRLAPGALVGIRRMGRKFPRFHRVAEGKEVGGGDHLVRFEGIERREEAERMKGSDVFFWDDIGVDPSEFGEDEFDVGGDEEEGGDGDGDSEEMLSTAAGEETVGDEFLVRKLVGCAVLVSSDVIGVVSGVILRETKIGHDYLEIELGRKDEEKDEEKEQGRVGNGKPPLQFTLVPFVPSIAPTVNTEEKRIVLTPPEGLIESCKFFKREKPVVIKGYLPERATVIGKKVMKGSC